MSEEGGAHAGGAQRWPLMVGLLWGAAEATVFFIVPDVWISFMTLRGVPHGIRAFVGAVPGAVAGGTALAIFARSDPEAARALVDAVPGVTPEVMARAADLAGAAQPWGMILGSVSGLPYKTFAVLLASEMPLGAFAAASILARTPRFVLTILIVWAVARMLPAGVTLRQKSAILGMVWVSIYAILFWSIGL